MGNAKENSGIISTIIKWYWLIMIVSFPVVYGSIYDETLESAKIILDIIHYPDGHPNQFHLHALNLNNYISALVLYISDDDVLNGFRFIYANTVLIFSVFYLARKITSALWGHILLVILSLGTFSALNNYLNYSIDFPGYFATHGNVGFSLFILMVALFSFEKYKSGFFVLGIMPVFHLAFVPPIILWLVLKIFVYKEDNKILNKYHIYAFSAGLLITALTFIVIAMRVDGINPSGIYEQKDVLYKTWLDFVNNYDRHRRGPVLSSYLPFSISLYLLWLINSYYRFNDNKATKEIIRFGFISGFIFVSAALLSNVLTFSFNYFEIDEAYYIVNYLLLSWIPYRYDGVIMFLTWIIVFKLYYDMWVNNLYKISFMMIIVVLFLIPLIIYFMNPSLMKALFLLTTGLLWSGAERMVIDSKKIENDNVNICDSSWIVYIVKYKISIFLAIALTICLIFDKTHWIDSISYMFFGSVIANLIFTLEVEHYLENINLLVSSYLSRVLYVLVLIASIFVMFSTPNVWKNSVGDKFFIDFKEHRFLNNDVKTYFSSNVVDEGKFVITPISRTWRFLSANHNIPILITTDTLWLAFYMPKYIEVIKSIYTEAYEFNLFKKDEPLYNKNNNVWRLRSEEKWRLLSEKYNIQYIITDYELDKLTPSFRGDSTFIYKF